MPIPILHFPVLMHEKTSQVPGSIFNFIFSSKPCLLPPPFKYACGQMAGNHLVHFWIHHEGPTLGGAGFLQGHFNQWPVFLSGVR